MILVVGISNQFLYNEFSNTHTCFVMEDGWIEFKDSMTLFDGLNYH